MKTKIISAILLIIPALLFSQEVGKEAKPFSGKTSAGENVSLSDYKGNVLLLDFWASWCKPCKEEMPYLIDLYNQYSEKNFSIVGINVDENSSDVNNFLTGLNKDVPYKIIFDPQGKIPDLYNISAMPSVFLIDKNGKVRYMHIGFLQKDKEQYKNEIETLLNE